MVNKYRLRSIGFEHNGITYHVDFRWSFFCGVKDGEVWAAKGGSRLLTRIGPIQYGTENFWARLSYWAMVAWFHIKHRLQVSQSKRQQRKRVSHALRAGRKT